VSRIASVRKRHAVTTVCVGVGVCVGGAKTTSGTSAHAPLLLGRRRALGERLDRLDQRRLVRRAPLHLLARRLSTQLHLHVTERVQPRRRRRLHLPKRRVRWGLARSAVCTGSTGACTRTEGETASRDQSTPEFRLETNERLLSSSCRSLRWQRSGGSLRLERHRGKLVSRRR